VFFAFLDRALTAERWGQVAAAAITFGGFMAVWNGPMIRFDSKNRTARNIVFENIAAFTGAPVLVAGILTPFLDHFLLRHLALYTIASALGLTLVWFLTRRHIKGSGPDELFV
jgi:hypothetical protein